MTTLVKDVKSGIISVQNIFDNMKFKDLKSNDYIYSLDLSSITYNKYRVLNTSQPRIDLKVTDSTVVDVTIDNNIVLVFKSEDVIGERNDVFYTTDFNLLLDKIKSISNSIQMKLNEVDKLKSNKELCDKLLSDLDPEIKERQKSEKRLTEVEDKVNGMSSDLSDIKKYLKKLLDDKKSI